MKQSSQCSNIRQGFRKPVSFLIWGEATIDKQHPSHDDGTATTTAATKRSYIKRSWHLLADSKRGIAQRSHQNAIKQSLTLRLATRAHSNNRRPFQNVRALKKPSYRMVAIQADGMPEWYKPISYLYRIIGGGYADAEMRIARKTIVPKKRCFHLAPCVKRGRWW